MKVNSFKRTVCAVLALLFCVGAVVIPASAATSTANENLEEMKKYLATDSYADYLNRYTAANIAAGDAVYTSVPDLADSSEGAALLDEASWSTLVGTETGYRPGSVYSPSNGKTSFTFNVNATGMYFLAIEYFTIAETVNSIERKLFIDGDIPFSEASLLSLSKTWEYAYEDTETGFKQDIIGNDLTPSIGQASRWQTYFFSDSNGYSNDYYCFYLTAGQHTVSLEAIRESAVFGTMRATPVDDTTYSTTSYADYLNYVVNTLGATQTGADAKVVMQAEKPTYVSDSSVMMSNNKSSSINEPTSPLCDLYNVIGASSYSSVGQWAAYSFEVPETGLYHITMRYLQSALEGMFVSRAIKLTSNGQGTYRYGLEDGTPAVPFTEAYSSRFNFSKDWNVGPVNDGTDDFQFYFEKGVSYTVYFEVSLGALAEQLKRVEDAMSQLNDCYLQILKLTGSDPDQYRDYRFSSTIPDTIWYLNYEARELQDVRDEFERICGSGGSHLATMDNIIRLIGTMGTDTSKIAANLANLKTNLGTLGTWISSSKKSTLIVDYISIQSPQAELGRAKSGFFTSLWYEVRAFFSSFFTDYDQMGVTNENNDGALNVWLASGRDQSKVVRNLVDSHFSEYCKEDNYAELPVALKLVTAGTLLPSILAGKGPDVYMGLDAGTIMNYAIREAILPVDDMEGFDSVTDNFHDAAINSITLLERTYGIPSSMSFAMMFYRIDTLVKLKATVPQTWDELLSLLPALQANNMEIGLNYTLALDFFLYQNGGNMWRYINDPVYQGAKIGLDTDEGLTAFEFCAGLYTDYSFPVSYDAANRFRTGEMPIVIQDYVSTYNTLIVFATELDGLWSFTHIPGVEVTDDAGNAILDSNGDKKVNYTSMAGVSAAVITKSGEARKRDAWEFIKWCTGAEYISEYANRMVSLLGPSAKYAAANMDALDDMSWTTDEVTSIREQMAHLDAIINYPGSYIIGRYTNFAFLAAVNDGKDAVEALRDYISAINAEVSRKREEFNMSTLEGDETPETKRAESGQ